MSVCYIFAQLLTCNLKLSTTQNMNEILNYISIGGALAFAISGALTAMKKRFDPFGVFIVAFATATGGGTLRDMLLEGKEVFWFVEPTYIYFILAGTIVAIIFRNKLYYLRKHLLFFDTVGLGLYTIIGVEIGLAYDLHHVNCVILGTITGSFGGVIRDILVNEIPVIFKKEIYASVSIIGGTLYILIHDLNLNPYIIQLIPILTIIILRFIIIYFEITLPTIYKSNKKEPLDFEI